MFRISCFVLFLCCIQAASAQVISIVKPIIKSGKAYPPVSTSPMVHYNTVAAEDTVLFKGELEIVFGGDTTLTSDNGFYSTGYDVLSNEGYFHAYLVPPNSYAELKPEPDGDYVVTIEHKVYFRYVEKYEEASLDYKLYDYKRIQKLPSFTLPVTTIGANYYRLDLKNLGLQHNQYYMLEVRNSKGEMGYLRIKYINAL
jgi:hypothetical protein